MSATLVTPKTASGGEIIRELSNSSDGQGLHFDGATGNIDIATPPDLGAKFSFEFVVKADEWGSDAGYFLDFSNGGRFIFGTTSSQSYNISIYDNTSWGNFGVKVLDDLKIHHLVVTVDGTAATLYDNGNQVGTLTISASHGIDSCSDLTIGPGGTGTPMSFYRTRFYNKTLTQAEVDNAYQRADVDFADQYGSQTKVIDSDFNGSLDGWNTYNDWNTQTNNSNAMQLGASAATQVCRNSVSLVGGKKYRVEYTASALTGAPTFNSYDAGTYTAQHTITAGSNSFEMDWPVGNSVDFLYIRAESATAAVTLDDIFVYQIGAVTDYDLAFANPTQSLMVQDRAGVADGTASASGVSQTQKIVQLNSTSARIGTSAATPADGELAVGSKIGISTTGSARQLHVKNTSGYAGAEFEATAENDDAFVTFNTHGNAAYVGIDDSADVLKLNATSGLSSAAHIAITSAGLVGINESDPGRQLTVVQSTTPTDFSDPILWVGGNGGADSYAANNKHAIGFHYVSNGDRKPGAAIGYTVTSNTGSTKGDLLFATRDVTTDTAPTTRMTISSAGNVAIGSSAASEKLHLMADGSVGSRIERASNDGNSGVLDFYKTRGTLASKSVVGTADTVGALRAYGYDGSNYIQGGELAFKTNGTPGANDMPTQFVVSTTADGASSPTERLTITSAGLVGIGDTSPSEKLCVNDSANDLQMRIGSLTAGRDAKIRLQGKNAANSANRFADIGLDAENGILQFWTPKTSTPTSVAATISSAGLATFANGIAFQSATGGTGTGTGYTLDKYEEGTFTATLTASTPPTSACTTTANYTRIGNLVYIQGRFSNKDTSGASGPMSVTGLPFTAANTNDSNEAQILGSTYYNLPISTFGNVAQIGRNTSTISFISLDNDAPWGLQNISAGTSRYLHFAGVYNV